ncbi:MAG: CHASE2 domain-containing protein [Vulcanococcus sp.]
MRRWFRQHALMVGVGVATAAFGLLAPEALERAELTIAGGAQEWRGPRKVPGKVVIVAIDDYSLQQSSNADLAQEESLRALQQWPWPRATYTTVLERLFASGAQAVAFDLLFDTPSSYGPSDDARFAAGLRASAGRVVLGAQVLESRGSLGGLSLQTPIAELKQAAGPRHEGLLNGFLNSDGTIRQRPSHYANRLRETLGAQVPPSLGEALLGFVQTDSRYRELPNGWIPLLDPYGPPRTITTIPIWHLLEPNAFQALQQSQTLRNSLVLIGPTAAVLQDLHHTPFAGLEGMPGVEIHATEVANRLEGRALWWQPSSPLWWMLTGALVTAAGLLCERRERPLTRLGIGAALGAGGLALTVLCISQWGVGLRLLGLSAGCLSAGAISSGQATITLQLNRRRLKRSLSRYLSPAVAAELANQPEEADELLGGKLTDVVILMSDIRGFTAYTQAMSGEGRAEELVSRLNRYFSELVEALHAQGATVDKFIGDAALAVFGAPIQRGAKAEADAALRAALEMEQRLKVLNASWQSQGEPTWEQVIVLSYGSVISGNIGSKRRMDYTVIGDAVNTASRLEAIAKSTNRSIVISAAVAELLDGHWPLEDLGEFPIRGQTPQHVFALASDPDAVTPPICST